MIIGIDASRAYISDKTGTENYSFHLITHILRLPESRKHTFVLFIRPKTILPKELAGYDNVIVKEIKMKYLWTQVGLAWETWHTFMIHDSRIKIQVLWVPAHTLPVLRNPRVKTVVTIHGLEYQWLSEYNNFLQRWYLPLSTIYATRYADKLIAVSKFTANELKKEVHNISEKIKVVYEGVRQDVRFQTKDVSRIHKRYELQDKKYILFVGTIQPRKNLVSLIEAFSRITVPDLKLVIAGGIGWTCEEVLQAPRRYGVQEKVVFTGRVSESELQSLYRGAVLYVQPSITEGFGLPVLEAMSHGVPVIVSDGGALSEVVGEAGLIVRLNNQSSITNNQKNENFVVRLASAMKRVVGSEKLQKQLISMGHKRIELFTWEKAAKHTLKALVG